MTVSQLKKLLEPYSDLNVIAHMDDAEYTSLGLHEIESMTVTVAPDGDVFRVVLNIDAAETV